MTLADDVLAALPALRSEAEGLMVETCTASRPGIPFTDDGGVVITPVVEVYAGRCKIQSATAQAASPVAGGHAFTVERLQVHFPVGAAPATGDTVLITASLLDPTLVGLTFRLVEQARGSHRTAARWNVELVTA